MQPEQSTVIGDDFVMLIQNKKWGQKLMDFKELGFRTRVLLVLLDKVTYGNEVWQTGTSIARALGTSPMVVNRHLAYYAKVGLIRRGGDGERFKIYLNEDFFWKGGRVGRIIAKRQSKTHRLQRSREVPSCERT